MGADVLSSNQPQVKTVKVFASRTGGGNPAPVVLDADGMTDAEMQDVARRTGHESVFVFSAPEGETVDYEFRFWVPNHEMEMCGHATLAASWLLARTGRVVGDCLRILTKSGVVDVRLQRTHTDVAVEISQPQGRIEGVDASVSQEILDVLGIASTDLIGHPIQNAATSRVKTLVPLKSIDLLDGLAPDFSRMEAVCTLAGSTGLYPFAVVDFDRQIFSARQFPKSSGYPEDAATGIAAAALSFGLLQNGLIKDPSQIVTIEQGNAMGRPSKIFIRFELNGGAPIRCWLSGATAIELRLGTSQ